MTESAQPSLLQQGYALISKEFGGADNHPNQQNRGPTNTHGNIDQNHKEQQRANPLDFTGTMHTISDALSKKSGK